MPKTNVPVGATGIFVPVIDGAWTFLPAASWGVITRVAGGNYRRDTNKVAGTEYAVLNLSKILEAASPPPPAIASVNAPGGGLQGSGVLMSFDLVYAITAAAMTSVTMALYETAYTDGGSISIKAAGNTPALALSPGIAGSVSGTLTNPWIRNQKLADAWLIGGGGPDNYDSLEIAIVDPGTTPVFSLYGVQLYFGQ